METIYLIGFMGSGKSSVAKILSEILSVPFVDTDVHIEKKYNLKIADIFKKHGEDTFRKYESEVLKKVSTHFNIISTGGGIVERIENVKTMQSSGKIIYLHTSFDEITKRLKHDASRPLWDNEVEERKALYERRILLYKKYANDTMYTNGKTVEEIAEEIRKNS